LAPLAWEPRAGLLAAVAGLALAAPRIALVPALGLAILARLLPPAPGAIGFGIVTLPFLVPAFLLPARGRWERPVAALLLTIAARAVPGPASLAAPLALAALGTRREGPGAAVQRVWTGALLLGACLLAVYPWLRPTPLLDLIPLLGPIRTVALAAVALVLLCELGSALPRWPIRRPALLAGLALFLALALRVPRPGTRLLQPEQGIRLDAASPVWEAALPVGAPVSGVAVESALSNSAQLATGTPVATLRLEPGITLLLRAGRETGEWAARRPDVVAASAGNPAPRPWMTWVAGGFFGQRYRALLPLSPPRAASRLRIERLPGLPPDLEIAIQQIEVER
jgi:hypothetical protein